MPVATIQCQLCGEETERRTALQRFCRPCAKQRKKENDRAWRLANREKVRAAEARWREKNPERNRAIKKRYRDKNKEKMAENSTRWRKENRERYNELVRNWINSTPGYSSWLQAHYSSRQLGVPGTFLLEEWQAKLEKADGRCTYCNEEAKLTLDHIIPLSRQGSSNTIENVTPACKRCNSSKHNRTPEEWEAAKCS